MSEFRVGEIAIFQNAKWDSSYNGLEVVVRGSLQDRVTACGRNGQNIRVLYSYAVESETEIFHAEPHQLRKKRPPEETTSWDSVEKITGWKPREPETIEALLNKVADSFNKWKALEHP